VGGALGNRPLALLSWLIFYFFNILGCFVLSGILGATVVHRNKYYGDIELGNIISSKTVDVISSQLPFNNRGVLDSHRYPYKF